MRIGLSMLSGVSYGGVTYFKNLIPALARIDDRNEYHIFVPPGSSLPDLVQQPNFFFDVAPVYAHSQWQRFAWEQILLPIELKKKSIDVVFTAKNANILLAPCKTIIAIRNMQPFAFREYQNSWGLKIGSFLRLQLSHLSLMKADRIIAVSRSSKTRVEGLFPETAGRWEVVYNGNPVDAERATAPQPRPHAFSYFLSASKYVSYANQLALVEAYSVLCQRRPDAPPLLLAGGVLDRDYFEQVQNVIRRDGLESRVQILGLVPHDRLLELYAAAGAFVFPSTLEACPHTLIEAMAYGLPIAAANVDPSPEVCLDAAIYFDPHAPTDIADKMEAILCDGSLRQRLQQRALRRCAFFDWDKTAREMVRVFEDVGKQPRR